MFSDLINDHHHGNPHAVFPNDYRAVLLGLGRRQSEIIRGRSCSR